MTVSVDTALGGGVFTWTPALFQAWELEAVVCLHWLAVNLRSSVVSTCTSAHSYKAAPSRGSVRGEAGRPERPATVPALCARALFHPLIPEFSSVISICSSIKSCSLKNCKISRLQQLITLSPTGEKSTSPLCFFWMFSDWVPTFLLFHNKMSPIPVPSHSFLTHHTLPPPTPHSTVDFLRNSLDNSQNSTEMHVTSLVVLLF